MTHTLKTDPEVYDALHPDQKTFEIRFNDRNFQVGDFLILERTESTGAEMKEGAPLVYSERRKVRRITYIMRGPVYGLSEGWVIMSVKPYEHIKDGAI